LSGLYYRRNMISGFLAPTPTNTSASIVFAGMLKAIIFCTTVVAYIAYNSLSKQ